MFTPASRLGFGCAALGSRVDAGSGLRALSVAYDKGINWFDLAPSYGNGRAEAIFARFAAGRRGNILICTKCGIAPPRMQAIGSMLAPAARALSAIHPGLRRAIARTRPPAVHLPLSGELITGSLEASLQRLRTDYVDVLALHDPHPADLAREDVRAALGRAVSSGRARAVGIAGSGEVAEAALRLKLPVTLIQLANNPFEPQLVQLSKAGVLNAQSVHVATHSAFGPPGCVKSLVAEMAHDPGAQGLLRQTGYDLPIEQGVRSALIDYALQTNPTGTVLFSMFTPAHLDFNLARANAGRRGDPLRLFEILHKAVAP